MMNNESERMEENTPDFDEFPDMTESLDAQSLLAGAIVKAQNSLTNQNVNDGFIQFRVLIENAEIIAKSAMLIDAKIFDSEIEKFMQSSEYLGVPSERLNEMAKSVRLANKKLGLILESVFKSKPIYASLNLRDRKSEDNELGGDVDNVT